MIEQIREQYWNYMKYFNNLKVNDNLLYLCLTLFKIDLRNGDYPENINEDGDLIVFINVSHIDGA